MNLQVMREQTDSVEFWYCAMVTRANQPNVTLNTDGESRSYRPLEEIEWL